MTIGGTCRIGGRILAPFSLFFDECWDILRVEGLDGREPPVEHESASLIGHELLLASEFCDRAELRTLTTHFHLSEIARFDLIRTYRGDVATYLRLFYGEDTS